MQLPNVALMELCVWLMDLWRVQAEWKSASMESGGQFVMMDGIPTMPVLCADSWDFLDQVLACTVLSVKVRLLCIGPKFDMCT